MSTFFCAFSQANDAERVALTLVNQGTSPDDISVLSSNQEQGAQDHFTDLTDVTNPVGTRDEAQLPRAAILQEDFIPESPIGGGISTSTPDDDISSIDESDDSQELANNASQPHVTQALIEDADQNRPIKRGFADDFEMSNGTATGEFTSSTDQLLGLEVVPGLGVAMGGGELATAALGITHIDQLTAFLRDRGVSKSDAAHLLDFVQNHGSILSVELSKGVGQASSLEATAREEGAKFLVTVGSPAY